VNLELIITPDGQALHLSGKMFALPRRTSARTRVRRKGRAKESEGTSQEVQPIHIDPALLGCSGAEQKQPQIPFDFAQGRLSTSLRFAQDDSSRVMQFFRAE
jgi:hypothetical protein